MRSDSQPIAPAHGIEMAKTRETSPQETVLVRAIQNQAITTHMHPSHAPRLARSVLLSSAAATTIGRHAHTAIACILRSTFSRREAINLDVRCSHHSRSPSAGSPGCSSGDSGGSYPPGPPRPGPPAPTALEGGEGRTVPYPPGPGIFGVRPALDCGMDVVAIGPGTVP